MSAQQTGTPEKEMDGLRRRLADLEASNDELRNRLAAQQRHSERYLRTLDHQETAIHVVDENLRVLFFNTFFKSWCHRLGIHLPRNPIGDTVFELFPFLKKNVTGEYRNVFRSGEKHTSEETVTVGKILLTVNTQKLPVFSGDRVCEVITIIRDVSEKRRDQAELQASEQRLKILFESAPDAYYLMDQKGAFLDGNRAAEKLVGYSRDELIGKTFRNARLLASGQISRAARLITKSLGGRQAGPLEMTLRRKDGSEVAVDIRTLPVRIGGKLQILGIARDISVQKQAKLQKKRSIQNLQVLSSTAMRFVELSLEEDIYSIIGGGLQSLIGEGYSLVNSYSQEENAFRIRFTGGLKGQMKKAIELLGRDPRDSTFTPDSPGAWERIRQGTLVRIEGGIHEASFQKLPRKASDLVAKAFGIRSVYSAGFLNQGVLYGATVIFLKTAALENEEAVKAYIHQAAVALQKWHAEKSNARSLQEKEVMLREIHHRVKNNMQIVSSLLRLQAGAIEDPQTRELFLVSQNRIRSMALVHEGLYRSSDLAHIDFSRYIRSLVTHLFSIHRIDSGSLELETTLEEVSLDINRAVPCGLIVNELVTNVLKHAFPEGRRGRLRIALETADKDRFRLTVADNGVGIPDGIDIGRTSSLGLQLVHDLVRQIQGNLNLDRDGGTRIDITF